MSLPLDTSQVMAYALFNGEWQELSGSFEALVVTVIVVLCLFVVYWLSTDRIVESIGKESDVGKVFRRISSKRIEVRRAAVHRAAVLRDKRAGIELLRMLVDEQDFKERRLVLQCFQDLFAPGWRGHLSAEFTAASSAGGVWDVDPDTQAHLRDPRVFLSLLESANDAETGAVASTLIEEFMDSNDIDTLKLVLSVPDSWRAAFRVTRMLHKLNAPTGVLIDGYKKALLSSTLSDREQSLKELNKLGAAVSVDELIAVYSRIILRRGGSVHESGYHDNFADAVAQLAALCCPRATQVLRETWSMPNLSPWQYITITRELEKCNLESTIIVDGYIKAITSTGNEKNWSTPAVEALGRLKDRRALPALRRLLSTLKPYIVHEGTKTVENWSYNHAIDEEVTFTEESGDPEYSVVKAAIASIEEAYSPTDGN
jgi:hypothetical protein